MFDFFFITFIITQQIIDINNETIPTNHIFSVLVKTKIALNIKIVKHATHIVYNIFSKFIIIPPFKIVICSYFLLLSLFSLDFFKNTEPMQRYVEPRHSHTIPIELLFTSAKFIIAAK